MPLALTGTILMAGVQVAGPPAAADNAAVSAVLVDAWDGGVLYEQAADAPRASPDAARLMALYLAFESLDGGRARLTDPLPTAAGQPRVTVADGIRAIARDDGSPGLAGALARRLWGSETAYAEQMTQRARALGMQRSHFVNMTGDDDPRQVTSARDMATLVRSLYRDFPGYAATLGQPVGARHPGLLQRVAPAGCLVAASHSSDCRRTRLVAPGRQVIAVMLGKPAPDLADLGATAAAGAVVAQQALRGRHITLAGLPSAFRIDRAAVDQPSAPGDGLKIVVINRPDSPATKTPAPSEPPVDEIALTRTIAPVAAPAAPAVRQTLATASADDRWAIQVGAFASPEEARNQLDGLATRLPSPLGALPRLVQRAPGGLYRARFATAAPEAARAACEMVRRTGQSCLALAMGQSVAG